MRIPALSILAALIVATIAIPTSTNTPRSIQVRSARNLSATTPRNPLSSRSLSARDRLTHKTEWGLPNSRTYVFISVIRSINGPAIPALLSSTLDVIQTRIRDVGDGLIRDGFWSSPLIAGLQLTAMNADNHQTTWGVLGAAVGALIDWIDKGAPTRDGASGLGPGLSPGTVHFEIWDGGREVGVGQMG